MSISEALFAGSFLDRGMYIRPCTYIKVVTKLRAYIKTLVKVGASLQIPDYLPATFAFNSSNQFCTTTMLAGTASPSPEPVFSLIIRKRCPSGDTS